MPSDTDISSASALPARDSRVNYFIGTFFIILSMLMLISIVSYTETQNPDFHTTVQNTNLVGTFGVYLSYFSLKLIGICAWLSWLFFLWLAYMYFFGYSKRLNYWRLVASVVAFFSLCILVAMVEYKLKNGPPAPSNYYPYGYGGLIGTKIYTKYLHENIGIGGTSLIFGILLIASIIYITYDNLGRNLKETSPLVSAWWSSKKKRAPEVSRQESEKIKPAVVKIVDAPAATGITRREKTAEEPKPLGPTVKPLMEEPEPPIEEAVGTDTEVPLPAEPPGSRKITLAPFSPKEETAAVAPAEANLPPPVPPIGTGSTTKGLKIIASEEVKKASQPVVERAGDYVFPPLDLLQQPKPVSVDTDEETHQVMAESIVRTLGEFGVKVTMGEVHTGPVITRYDVYPAAGVRVEKIANLDKNLALNLKAMSVRILAPVPGKGCVGIEVPNRKPQPVCIRDIIESEDWVNFKGDIPVVLGKEVSGKPLIADLTRMPHLLIAGSTGSGKTVCINAIITSLLYRHSPDTLRFVMVDPKIVEMQAYNALPHMLIPVVTEPKKVPGALKYLLNEMERRYQIFAGVGVRNIAGYNAKQAAKKDDEAESKAREMDAALSPEERAAMSKIEVPRDLQGDLPRRLPYIVVIIDELADLMMVAPADVETGIARLAQLARAAGIHLIIATQRPSVNVITGVIKANLPSRIAFKVAAKVDSRTILDTMGADQLIGRGDLLFLPPGSSDLVRAQGAYVADEEINQIVEFLKRNGEPVFDEIFQRSVEESVQEQESAEEEEDDLGADTELINQSIEVLRTTRRASTSMLQRKLRIGYNRAARIMEILEEKGVVGPDNGAQPREILRDLENLRF